MKMVTFQAVTGEGDTGELHGDQLPGEDDVPAQRPAEQTLPVTIVDPMSRIRSFGPRKHGRPGTRIVFVSGAGLPVVETPEQVRSALEQLHN